MPESRLMPMLLTALAAIVLIITGRGNDFAVSLPDGVKAVWDSAKADRVTTSTREKICINGLWRWQPARLSDQRPPTNHWGYFKVPGCWPGITDYMQKDSQTLHAHPEWKNQRLDQLTAAWYERTITVPSAWMDRRMALRIDYLNSFAAVFIDGAKCGEVQFPGGELDLTANLRPGETPLISLLVIAMPLQGVLLSYTDSNSAREIKGKVERRGLCGDVFLSSTPSGPRILNVKIDTSIRKSEITVEAALDHLAADHNYVLRARITKEGRPIKEFKRPFQGGDLHGGKIELSADWKPDSLWDIDTPENKYDVMVSLESADGRALDASLPVRFGFREFWIDGRDFYLNGTRIFLCAVPLDNAQVSAAAATYRAARESLERLKNIGINFVYTHNYGCEPGSHLSFEEILRAADDAGMLVSFSQPHFSHYDWRSPDADQNNGYARHAAYYVRAAQNHPSVVAYAMSHNATGYEEDMNPDLIDGVHAPRDQWSSRNAALALHAEAIVKRLDPTRIVYHHASGNLGSMHAINFYPNFAPIQELSDWFEHWATTGVKPVFTCEYGAPFTWDWAMYRGWYKGQREFGSAVVPWEFCLAEWNSQFLGDSAFKISEAEAANLRWEAKQFRAGKVWHRWDYPNPLGSQKFTEEDPVFAMYFKDNWRAFRTWGVSAISPWEYEHHWRLRDGVDRHRKNLKVDWENLQRPGFSPDYIGPQFERMDLAFERSDWMPSIAAQSLLRNNRPLLAYIAGSPEHFTSKDHIFFPGDAVEKQLIVINNSRRPVNGTAECGLALPQQIEHHKDFSVATGMQNRVPLKFPLPDTLAPGEYILNATVRFSTGDVQTDSFSIHVIPRPGPVQIISRIALFDPKGETSALLLKLGVHAQRIDAGDDLSGFDTLIIGKSALTTNSAAPNISRVRNGLKVLVFEQTPEVLEQRLGFRVAAYGLRQVFPRVPDHPTLAGLSRELLRDWRGEATILPPRLSYTVRPRYGPTVEWCGLPVTRLWRCGNRGNVASVLIEKPARGDFLPILDGGFSLQYSPLLEYHEGSGMILFCQMDVTGRTKSEPAAVLLARNILQYIAHWKPSSARRAVYAGDPAGRRHLESSGFTLAKFGASDLSTNDVLVLGTPSDLAPDKTAIAHWIQSGGTLLALGLNQQTADAVLPGQFGLKSTEHISTFFPPAAQHSPFTGIASADVHNRDPRELPLVLSGATILGDGILAATNNLVFCQLLPWEFDPNQQLNLKRTYRRGSFLLTRLLSNLGIPSATPLLEHFSTLVNQPEKRWLDSFYFDQPEEWDDPYRHFRW